MGNTDFLTGIECPLYSFGETELKRPIRGPTNSAATNEHAPANKCTAPAPEKSEKPIFINQPSGDQTQCETTGYVKPEKKT